MEGLKPSHPHYQESNSLRTPDWRRLRAMEIVDRRLRRSRQMDDEMTLRLCAYLASNATDSTDLDNVPRRFQDVHAAFLLHRNMPKQARIVEARLLARQSDEEIANAMGLDAAVIGLYEAIFFDVRGRLGNSGWISSQVIGPGLQRGFVRDEMPLLWRAFGYQLGPFILELVLAVTQQCPVPSWLHAQGGDNPRVFSYRVLMATQLAVLGKMLPTPATAKAMRRLVNAQRALAKAVDADLPSRDRQLDLMLNMFAGADGRTRRTSAHGRQSARTRASGELEIKRTPATVASWPFPAREGVTS